MDRTCVRTVGVVCPATRAPNVSAKPRRSSIYNRGIIESIKAVLTGSQTIGPMLTVPSPNAEALGITLVRNGRAYYRTHVLVLLALKWKYYNSVLLSLERELKGGY